MRGLSLQFFREESGPGRGGHRPSASGLRLGTLSGLLASVAAVRAECQPPGWARLAPAEAWITSVLEIRLGSRHETASALNWCSVEYRGKTRSDQKVFL